MNLYDVLAGQGTTHFERLFSQSFAGGGKTQTLTGVPPLTFNANGTPLISWSMKGNGQQTGTPTPQSIIMPDFCGKLVGFNWTIPITCAGQTTPIYLGEVPTVRRVKKLVLDGTENWNEGASNYYIFINVSGRGEGIPNSAALSTHTESGVVVNNNGTALFFRKSVFAQSSLADFKSYLAAQYAAGTPVTIWYVLAEPETAIVNEPLAKIGDYADELSNTDAAVTIPTAKGQNTLTVDTDLQPSEMTITYKV